MGVESVSQGGVPDTEIFETTILSFLQTTPTANDFIRNLMETVPTARSLGRTGSPLRTLSAGDRDARPAFGAIPPSADEAKKKSLENSKTFRAKQRTHTKKRTTTEKRGQKGH